MAAHDMDSAELEQADFDRRAWEDEQSARQDELEAERLEQDTAWFHGGRDDY